MDQSELDRQLAMTEWPFVHKGMTLDEYWEERDYFIHHYEDYKNGTYKPLWKQRELKANENG